MLTSSQLSKKLKGKLVLSDVSFSVGGGEVVGIVGPNGSGKTTLLNILTGFLKPDNGAFKLTTRRIGFAISRKGMFGDMSVLDNLKISAKLLYGNHCNLSTAMDRFGIDYGSELFSSLSAGMQQRVSLVLPFAEKNDLLFLDEPTNHLDIDNIFVLKNAILAARADGSGCIVTSHVVSYLEKICDRIIFLKDGRIVQDVLTDVLLKKYGSLEDAYLDVN